MEDVTTNRDSGPVRWFGFALGVGTQIGFLITVCYLFRFLRNGTVEAEPRWLFVDGLLASQFAIVHSLVLHPATRGWLSKFIKAECYCLFFFLTTCVCLALIFAFWRGSQTAVWEAHGHTKIAIRCGFYVSWVSLFYSLSLSGLGYQTGLTPWWYWLLGQPQPRRRFVTHSLYRWLRHPIYLSFLGLIWFTPRMSWDHALLTGLWTVYIWVGSYLKDERMAFYIGTAYREYQLRVPAYPLIGYLPFRHCRKQASSLAEPASYASSLPRSA